MNRMLVCALAVLVFASMAGATPACTSGPINVTWSTSIDCGGLNFTHFNVISAWPATIPMVAYVSSDVSAGSVNLVFNPGLSGANGPQDLYFYFEVNGGPITGLDLGVGGSLATIDETACSAPIPTGGPTANLCPQGTDLAHLVAFSSPGVNHVDSFFNTPFSGTMYIFKDIGVAPGGALTSFTQSFHDVPEPASLMLIGTGLLALGFVRRRVRRA